MPITDNTSRGIIMTSAEPVCRQAGQARPSDIKIADRPDQDHRNQERKHTPEMKNPPIVTPSFNAGMKNAR